jgi:DNA repair exonuclease SbcCD ATPase subunit
VEAAAPSPDVARLESRVAELEARIEAAAESTTKSEALSAAVWSELGRELSDLTGRVEERFGALEERSEAEAARLRRADEALVEECARLRDRIERLEEQAALFAKDFQDLKRLLSELPPGREPGELPLQLAPLLEERVRREADENWTAEIERLRQALAESLDDLSERVRKAVRG